jgi:hypothetical protein
MRALIRGRTVWTRAVQRQTVGALLASGDPFMDTRTPTPTSAWRCAGWLFAAVAGLAAAPAWGEEEPLERPFIWRVQIERTPTPASHAMELHGAYLRQDPGVIDEAKLKRKWSHLLRIELDKGESVAIRPRRGGLMLSYRAEF